MRGKMKELCIVNIGNTHVQITCGASSRKVPSGEFTPDMLPEGPCAAASVVPSITAKIKAVRKDIFWITKDTPGIPDLSRVEADKLGADRIANASKLLLDGILPAMTIDCGTAIDSEIVDENGVYAGGTILPGRALLRRALNLFTAQLPEIPLYDELPESYPGTSTLSDLRWGTDGALLAAVQDLIERSRALFPGRHLRVVFCGGDGKFFADQLKDTEYGGADFTLSGIRALYEKKQKEKP